jgi:hypothetical protein
MPVAVNGAPQPIPDPVRPPIRGTDLNSRHPLNQRDEAAHPSPAASRADEIRRPQGTVLADIWLGPSVPDCTDDLLICFRLAEGWFAEPLLELNSLDRHASPSLPAPEQRHSS